MTILWFILVAIMLTIYVLLDGFDLGAGVLHLFAARGDAERRVILRAIGPVWDGNEVWLIAAGGTLFFAFPLLYASAFSGFYLPLIIVLWLLMGRGVAIELRSHLNNPIWASFWDGIFFLTSTLLTIFFGAALANVVRGVPLNRTGYFFEPLWTNFDPKSPQPGVLDWYTILVGVLACAALTMHGAAYIMGKTEGPVNARARRAVSVAWVTTIVLTVPATVATFWLRSAMLTRFRDEPWGLIFPLIALGGLALVGRANARGQELAVFAGSSAFLFGLLTATVFSLYPNVLPAINPAYSLTIHNAAAADFGLRVGLIWWTFAMVLVAGYFIFTYRMFRGKVRVGAAH